MAQVLKFNRKQTLEQKIQQKISHSNFYECADCSKEYLQDNLIAYIPTNQNRADSCDWYCIRCYNKRFND